MTKIRIYKASGMAGKEIESISIVIDSVIPQIPFVRTAKDAIAEANQIYDKDAETLCDALCRSIPGGALDRLTAKLMMRKASSMMVPLFDGKEKP